MSWRTVIITGRCKLDFKMGYLVVRGEQTTRVFLDEVAILVIENPALSLTGCLIEALTEKKIKVIFCDSKRSPAAELVPCHGSHDSSLKIRKRNTVFVIIGIALSVAMAVISCRFSLALLDFQDNYTVHEYVLENGINTASLTDETLYGIIEYTRQGDDTYFFVLCVVTLFIALGVLGSISSISGILTINSGQKAKTLSVLSTLGADIKHQAEFLAFDALIISIIAVPLGVALGILISFPLINSFTGAFYTNSGLLGYDSLPWYIDSFADNLFLYCVGFVLMGFAVIFAASFSPVLRLFKNSSVEIAKTSDAINISLKQNLIDKIAVKIFGIAGRLASQNFTNNRKKFRLISRSVSVCALMFILFSLLKAYASQFNRDVSEDKSISATFFVFYAFAFIIFILAFFGTCSLFYVNFNKRKPEFAMLLSMGMDRGLVFSAYKLLDDRYYFTYPWSEMAFAFVTVVVITLILSLFMTSSVRKINITDELKKNY